MKKSGMLASLVSYILGFDAVMLITGIVREFLAFGTINNRMTDTELIISGFSQPFGGFIFLGLFCGLHRKLRSVTVNENAKEKR